MNLENSINTSNEDKPLRMVLYARVSTHTQKTENQVLKLEEYAKNQGWKYVIFEEEESTKKTRPIKQHVLMALRNKVYDGVCIWRLDRWGRSMTELVMDIQELHKKGIIFRSLSDNIDFSTPAGKLQFHMLAAFAEFERNMIGERTREGLARAKAKGIKLGRPSGSTDKKRRKKSGYVMRDARVLKERDERNEVFKPIDYYIDNYSQAKRDIKKKQTPQTIEG